ncbi:unnamed protein product [Callosobruchus maculatus]|uniref:Uncharacterized protein n=1 Tax=Callosobruchus maculatus TaxID=64391 RepID=A0A653DT45_CALMS|nr:unnamed protein product [Callosobruchus maculatus]
MIETFRLLHFRKTTKGQQKKNYIFNYLC